MVIDIIFVIAAGYGFYLGFSRGIIQTVFTILSFLFGLVAAFKFAPAATNFLETAFNSDSALMFVAGFLLSFVLTMVIIRFFAKAIEGFLKTANINVVNQFAGGVLLGGVMILIYSVLLWFADQSHMIDYASKQQSFTYDYLEHFPGRVWTAYEFMEPSFKQFWDDSVDFMDKVREMGMERSEGDANIFDIEDDNGSNSTSN